MTTDLNRFYLSSSPFPRPTPCLFVDRDGVIIEDCHHLSDPDDVVLCRGARHLIVSACSQGWPVILITNQSGIARGFFNWQQVEQVHSRIQYLLGSAAPFAAIYANGHGPDAPADSWRKPSPEMLFHAARTMNLDLKRSLLIGDRLSDLQSGDSAGLGGLCHVLSGHGLQERQPVLDWHVQESMTLPDLYLLDSLDDFPLASLTKSQSINPVSHKFR